MSIGRERIETRVCERCHFHIGAWRERCQCGGGAVRVEYVRADLHAGAIDLLRGALTNSNAQAALSPEWREQALPFVVRRDEAMG